MITFWVNFYGTKIYWNQFECVLTITGLKTSTKTPERFEIFTCVYARKLLGVTVKAEKGMKVLWVVNIVINVMLLEHL